ncbi:MAG: thioredoxin domain-containing protein [Spirosomataceae bacterium]
MRLKNTFAMALMCIASVVAAQETSKLTPLEEFATKLSQQPKPQLIDARSPEEFALNHLHGAINFTLQTSDYEQRIKALDPSKPVFVYSIQNGRSSALSKDLRNRGFKEVYDLEKGIGNWVGSGRPIFTTAEKGISLASFQETVTTHDLVLVDIGSKFCGACKKVKPILEALRQEHGSSLKIIELELEENPELIASLKTVTGFPYLIVYKQGSPVLKKAGIADLQPTLEQALAK